MSTRAEILEALGKHPAGLTSKELAPLCPAADHDPQIVARVIAQLRTEHLIHAGKELRDGGAIWVLGKADDAPAPAVERITLPEAAANASREASSPSEAARAIAAIRRGQSRPPPTSNATPEDPAEEEAMEAKKSVAERIVEALKKHGQLDVDGLAKHAKSTKATVYTMMTTLKKEHGVIAVERGVYALAGGKAPAAKPAKKEKAVRKAAPRPRAPAARAETKKNGAAAFAINEYGELGIEHEGVKLSLDPAAFERLREFIDKTKPIWG